MKDPKIVKSAVKLCKDQSWRMSHLYHIIDKNKNKVLFSENDIQKQINLCTSNRKCILKARQFGVSTNELIRMADATFFGMNQTNVILSHEQDSIEKLFRIVWTAYNNMPDFWKPVLDRGGGSKYEMYFPANNSRIYVDLESRSDTISWLHSSETAFSDPDRIKATLEAVPLGGKITFESTPNGIGNFFHELWSTPSDSLAKLFFPWFFAAEYSIDVTSKLELTQEEKDFTRKAKILFGINITNGQIAFRRHKQETLKELFHQEYPEDDVTCFLSSGAAAMDLVLIKQLIDETPKPIRQYASTQIYKEYEKGRRYAIGADTAEGVGKDKSAAVMFDVKTRQVVAVIHSDCKPIEFAHQLNELAKQYRSGASEWPLLGVERNNHGHAVLLWLLEHIRYPNLFSDTDGREGWKTTTMSRPLMLDAFRHGVESKQAQLDQETLRQCLTLVVNKGKIEAASNQHDDLIMAAAIGIQMCIKSQPSEIWDNISSQILV